MLLIKLQNEQITIYAMSFITHQITTFKPK